MGHRAYTVAKKPPWLLSAQHRGTKPRGRGRRPKEPAGRGTRGRRGRPCDQAAERGDGSRWPLPCQGLGPGPRPVPPPRPLLQPGRSAGSERVGEATFSDPAVPRTPRGPGREGQTASSLAGEALAGCTLPVEPQARAQGRVIRA